jgi:beta-glucan synthesis-associated protein KRE6
MTSRRSPSSPPLRLEETRLLSSNPSSPNQVTQLPESTPPSNFSNPFSRSGSTAKSSLRLDDALIASLGLGHHNTDLHSSTGISGGSATGSMILYRLTDDPRTSYQKRTHTRSSSLLLPPQVKHRSLSGDSTHSFTGTLDSTSPFSTPSALRGLVPYLYDPALDSSQPIDDEDRLHDPTIKDNIPGEKQSFPWRGLTNVTVILVLISALLCLFILYPVWTFLRDRARNLNIGENININGTG